MVGDGQVPEADVHLVALGAHGERRRRRARAGKAQQGPAGDRARLEMAICDLHGSSRRDSMPRRTAVGCWESGRVAKRRRQVLAATTTAAGTEAPVPMRTGVRRVPHASSPASTWKLCQAEPIRDSKNRDTLLISRATQPRTAGKGMSDAEISRVSRFSAGCVRGALEERLDLL